MYNFSCQQGSYPYVIKSDDTIYKLARDFGTTIDAILSLNPNLKPNNLIFGQRICIPYKTTYPPCPSGNYYIIRPDDTLYKLSQMYKISIEEIIKANPSIDPNMLVIGQVICIPLPPYI